MQKTKTHLMISNINFPHFLLLFNFDNKLGEFYNLRVIKFLDYFLFLLLFNLDSKLGKFYSFANYKNFKYN